MAPTKVLVTGPTGYMGGTVLNHLLNSKNTTTRSLELNVLTRENARADTFRPDTRIAHVYTIHDLDDATAITAAASQNDIVIHCTSGFHLVSMKSFIKGLAQRKATNPGADVYFIRTDSTANLADRPITGALTESRNFSDKDADLFAYLKQRDAQEPYPQRTATITATETALAEGASTTAVMSPTIYGVGSGLFNHLTMQAPLLMRHALEDGKARYVGDGAGEWNCVHVEDLAALYELLVVDFASGRRVAPVGERGIVFAGTGTFRWREVAEGIARAGKALGVLEEEVVESVSLEDAAGKWMHGLTQPCELVFASNSRTRAEVAGEVLGWKTTRTGDAWERAFTGGV
ncbi:NAD(P)-binding protein [Bimuria novae-zelandiae CBS 107.79]|uniref:NAD(P)-binding protein n=1 Tax=Bimuria novae-zelandiae CBS 107.79 TaxID=1447943 RepID=A0A6A5VGT9_9PLEO|nr:NAD(P)-binding protein [Bimuria novae-zelandiae CBS 107.79]